MAALFSRSLHHRLSLSSSWSECMRVVESTSSECPLRSFSFFLLNCSEVQMKEWREEAWDFFLFKASALELRIQALLSISGLWVDEQHREQSTLGNFLLLWPKYIDRISLRTPIPQRLHSRTTLETFLLKSWKTPPLPKPGKTLKEKTYVGYCILFLCILVCQANQAKTRRLLRFWDVCCETLVVKVKLFCRSFETLTVHYELNHGLGLSVPTWPVKFYNHFTSHLSGLLTFFRYETLQWHQTWLSTGRDTSWSRKYEYVWVVPLKTKVF